ncbi:MAG: hypothetical protein FJX76_22940 [Armatimonadetes bacterium]|nr:hypothetical protein [Armatimonadota bacterium]
MGFHLEYRYQPGEALRYRLSVHMLVEAPGEAPAAGTAEIEVTQDVLAAHNDGSWTVEYRSRATQAEGILEGGLPAELLDRVVILRMNPQGALLDTGEGPPPVRVPAFPAEALEVGASWKVTDATDMEVTSVVGGVEDDVASIVSTASSGNDEDGSATVIEATLTFSLQEGCQLASTTVIETLWPNGRKMSLLLENELLERGASQATEIGQVG